MKDSSYVQTRAPGGKPVVVRQNPNKERRPEQPDTLIVPAAEGLRQVFQDLFLGATLAVRPNTCIYRERDLTWSSRRPYFAAAEGIESTCAVMLPTAPVDASRTTTRISLALPVVGSTRWYISPSRWTWS